MYIYTCTYTYTYVYLNDIGSRLGHLVLDRLAGRHRVLDAEVDLVTIGQHNVE
jgi:hypothetical protein